MCGCGRPRCGKTLCVIWISGEVFFSNHLEWPARRAMEATERHARSGRRGGTRTRIWYGSASATSLCATCLFRSSSRIDGVVRTRPRSAAAESTEAPESRLLRGCFASCSCTLRSRCRPPSPCAGAVPRCTTRAICACAEEPRFTRGPGQSWRLYAANVPCAPTCCVQIRVVCARCRSDDLRDVFPQRLQLIHWGR